MATRTLGIVLREITVHSYRAEDCEKQKKEFVDMIADESWQEYRRYLKNCLNVATLGCEIAMMKVLNEEKDFSLFADNNICVDIKSGKYQPDVVTFTW